MAPFDELEDHDFAWPDNYRIWLPSHVLSMITHPYWNPQEWEEPQEPDAYLGQ